MNILKDKQIANLVKLNITLHEDSKLFSEEHVILKRTSRLLNSANIALKHGFSRNSILVPKVLKKKEIITFKARIHREKIINLVHQERIDVQKDLIHQLERELSFLRLKIEKRGTRSLQEVEE